MITSKLTRKAQMTVPHSMRVALRLWLGKRVATVIEAGRVVTTRAQAEERCKNPFGTFAEWDSPTDSEAYAEL